MSRSIDSLCLSNEPFEFRTSAEVDWKDCPSKAGLEKCLLGYSEFGVELWAFKLGHGSKKVSLIAGCHSDEPLGPETLRRLVKGIYQHESDLSGCLSEFTFYILPHINPDGEAKNARWMKQWPSLEAYLSYAFRELPGRDLEFGFPEMRLENKNWSQWLKDEGPFDLHISFHGMGYSEGAMLLIEKHWIDRTEHLRQAFIEKSKTHGYGLHDHDRHGDKGFHYIGPGFTTTPEGGAMKEFFLKAGDDAMAKRFHLSSMEWIRSLGGDPLCLVSELPLFCIHQQEGRKSGLPVHHLAFKKAKQLEDFNLKRWEEDLEIRPFPIQLGLELHLFILKQALKLI